MLHRSTNATMEVRSADGDHAFGLKPSIILVDELAQWEESRRARRLWTAIVSSLSQKCPIVASYAVSSAGEPGHWSYRVLQDAKSKPERWHVSEVEGPLPWLDIEDLKAQGLRDSEFARLHLNIWTQAEDRLVDSEDLRSSRGLARRSDRTAGRFVYLIACDLGLMR